MTNETLKQANVLNNKIEELQDKILRLGRLKDSGLEIKTREYDSHVMCIGLNDARFIIKALHLEWTNELLKADQELKNL